MNCKRIITLLAATALLTGCNQNNNSGTSKKKSHIAVLKSCANDLKELNKGESSKQTREINHDVEIVPGALFFPVVFCYYASLLCEIEAFDVETNVVEYTADVKEMGGLNTVLTHLRFNEDRFLVYFATVSMHEEQPYCVYQLFDCEYNKTNNKMENFVYFLGNQFSITTFAAYEYVDSIYSCYYYGSDDEEMLQDTHFVELKNYYQGLEDDMNSMFDSKIVVEDSDTIKKCAESFSNACEFVYN